MPRILTDPNYSDEPHGEFDYLAAKTEPTTATFVDGLIRLMREHGLAVVEAGAAPFP